MWNGDRRKNIGCRLGEKGNRMMQVTTRQGTQEGRWIGAGVERGSETTGSKTAFNQTQVETDDLGQRPGEGMRSFGDERQETSPTDFLRIRDLSCPRPLTVMRRHARSFIRINCSRSLSINRGAASYRARTNRYAVLQASSSCPQTDLLDRSTNAWHCVWPVRRL